MLMMKKVYFEVIRSGLKTTTLRYWRWRRVRAGSVHNVRGLGKLRIDDICEVALSELAQADARADGFENTRALGEALEAMYPPEKRRDRKLYKLQFTYLGLSDERTTA